MRVFAVRSGALKGFAWNNGPSSGIYWHDLNDAVGTFVLSARLPGTRWKTPELNLTEVDSSHTKRGGSHANSKVQCMRGPVAKTICQGAILLCRRSEELWQEIALRVTTQAKHIFQTSSSSSWFSSSTQRSGFHRAETLGHNKNIYTKWKMFLAMLSESWSSRVEQNCYLLHIICISCTEAWRMYGGGLTP